MPNMSYCRFRNTLDAMRDCFEHMETPISDRAEAKARLSLVELCKTITEEYSDWFDGYPDADGDDADAA